jgi:protein TilB
MPVITRELLRRRAEHNEGILSTLEEVTLHQEELEGINEVLGTTCRRLRILYLQNNLIGRIENLTHLKELGYLNLALNNIKVIEGLHNCEFLHKLDLTINFIDVDGLEQSIDHLVSRTNLTDLYMMGNPCEAKWEGFKHYVIAKLPQLKTLDGAEITRSMQIVATQSLPRLDAELKALALAKLNEAATKAEEKASDGREDIEEVFSPTVDASEPQDNEPDPNEMTDNTPEARVKVTYYSE